MSFHGSVISPGVDSFDVQARFADGANLYQYLGSNPWQSSDPSGLFITTLLPGPGDFITAVLESIVKEYAVNLEWDVEWATEWESPDDMHSRLENSWIVHAIGRGLYNAFEIELPGDHDVNLLDPFTNASRKKKIDRPSSKLRSPKGVSGKFSNGWQYRVDTHKVLPDEGGFHIHVYKPHPKNNRPVEVAKINGHGGWEKTHGSNQRLMRPTEVPKSVKYEINRLVRWTAW
jgi:hypothetical protein